MSWSVYTSDVARDYDSGPEHLLAPGEVDWWCAQLDLAGVSGGASVLDMGAGTGLLLKELRARGFAAKGLEPAQHMISQAVKGNSNLQECDFIRGPADASALVPAGSFDAVVSRQVLCHLTEPQQSFEAALTWLRPGGVLLAVDGLWSSESWSATQRGTQPFACLIDETPVLSVLKDAGFCEVSTLDAKPLNALRQEIHKGSVHRYGVVATRP